MDFITKFKLNSVLIILYVSVYNYKYISVFINNYFLICVINIIGLYLFLNHISFEINITCSIKFK